MVARYEICFDLLVINNYGVSVSIIQLLHWKYALNAAAWCNVLAKGGLLSGWDFLYKTYDEEMNNPLLILTLLTIISLDMNGNKNLKQKC